MRIIGYLFLLVIVVFGMSFATLNSDKVTINYYLGLSTMPLSLLVVLVFVFGCLLGLFAGFILLMKAKIVMYQLRQRLQLAEKEINNLRAIPIQDRV